MSIFCKIELTNLAKDDLSKLSREMQQECFDMLKKLQDNLHLGLHLGNNGIRNLSNCYKLYFHNAEYRIIYVKENDTISIHEISTQNKDIAKVIGIGPRINYEIYDTVAKRLNKFIKNEEN